MRYRFPENFWWGSACSALQTEGDSLNGGKSQTTWDVWFDRQPGRFHQGVGPATTCWSRASRRLSHCFTSTCQW